LNLQKREVEKVGTGFDGTIAGTVYDRTTDLWHHLRHGSDLDVSSGSNFGEDRQESGAEESKQPELSHRYDSRIEERLL